RKVLLKGYGNPAREDDGLGPAVAEELERLHIAGLTVDVDYQLSVEDSAALAEHDTVIFVDASIDGKEPYSFSRVEPKRQESFSSHSVSPEAVFYLAMELFGARSDVYVLAVRGYSFNMFTEEMTSQAKKNMREAVNFLVSILHTGIFQEF
ncbi:MAG TPA: hydrogenase maturation protease, partial [Spirochaetia bacterium]|nr:hydrogenase maturation protease [Spirochaetia bacterium]